MRKDSLVQGATTKRILSFATMILLMSTCSAIFVIPLKDDPEMPDYLKNLETYQLNPQAYLGNKEVYGFGVVVRDLPKCTDSDFIQGLTDLLLEYHFNISYSTRGPSWTSKPRDKYNSVTFDCSDMSRATWRLLKEYGYDARLMMGQDKRTKAYHAWVPVKNGNCWVIVEATNGPSGAIGIVESPQRRFHILDYNEYYNGLMVNTSAEFMLYSDDTVPIYMDTPLKDLPLYRWRARMGIKENPIFQIRNPIRRL